MHLRTLGTLDLQGGTFTRPKPLLLLTYLALEGPRDRHHLSEVLFARARDPMGSLRTTLARLRRELPDGLTDDGNLLRAHVTCDAQLLLAHLDAHELRPGVRLYTGPFLAGAPLTDASVALEEWVYAMREHLATRVRTAFMTLADGEAARGAFAAAATLAERAAWLDGAPDPEPEEFTRLAELLSAGESPLLGRLAREAREYGIDVRGPSEDARRALQRGFTTSPWGPPARTTSFVGRDAERADITRALASPEVRLLTLVGPGGIGKTRLALEVARERSAHGPVAFASLEAITSLQDLPTAIAAAVGVTLPAHQWSWSDLLDALGDAPRLLILDSVEHLPSLAPLVSRLLQACPGITALVTSRERLSVDEEWVLTIHGLSGPAPDASARSALDADAVQLFTQRARRARPDFTLSAQDAPAVVRIVDLVGGSPLGLELAAAWTADLTPGDIASSIEGGLDFLRASDPEVPEKHHSMRAVFDQTWARLTPGEQLVLARLSVFRGGFTRESAGAVADATLMTLARLADKSLIRAEPTRFAVHVLLLQFARERLARQADVETAALDAHGREALTVAERAHAAFQQQDHEKRWFTLVHQDLDNIRAALTRWARRGEMPTLLRCVMLLRNYWVRAGRLREARRWFALAFGQPDQLDPELLEQALGVDGEMAMHLRDHVGAQQQLRAALDMAEERGAAAPLNWLHLGIAQRDAGHLQAARGTFTRARDAFHASGQRQGVAAALINLGNISVDLNDLQGAQNMFMEALDLKRQLGHDVETAMVNIGHVHLLLANHREAKVWLMRALHGFTDRGVYSIVPDTLEGLALVAQAEHRLQPAAVLLGAVQAQRDATGVAVTGSEGVMIERATEALRAELPPEAFAALWAQGAAMTQAQAVVYALEVSHEGEHDGLAPNFDVVRPPDPAT